MLSEVSNNKYAMLFCFEINRGGETLAIRSVIKQLKRDKRLEVTEFSSDTFLRFRTSVFIQMVNEKFNLLVFKIF